LDVPRMLQVEFSRVIQRIADETGKEISPQLIWEAFQDEYVRRDSPIAFREHSTVPDTKHPNQRLIEARIVENGAPRTIEGHGNGPIAAYVDALARNCGVDIRVQDYHQHAIGHGADARSVTYIEAQRGDGQVIWGVGISPDIVAASLHAVTSAVNRALAA
uniref:alpha-isopropylmalate synthase regulatory domain-containing protein n=1 Tax=Stella sp. TaxID=2912054 RepID=UPI0035AE54CD